MCQTYETHLHYTFASLRLYGYTAEIIGVGADKILVKDGVIVE